MNTLTSHIIKFFCCFLVSFLGYVSVAQNIRIPEIPRAGYIGEFLKEDTLTIRIFGDLMMHSQQISAAATKEGSYNFDEYFTHIQKFLNNSDLNIANLEFTLAGKPFTGYPAFSAPDEYAMHISKCGFNVFLTANNHICDKASYGMSRTLDIYRKLKQEHDIQFTGTASNQEEYQQTTPLIIECKGVKIAIINATYGTNLKGEKAWPKTNYLNDRKALLQALQVAEEQADITLVLPHWGEEYKLRHNSTQKATAQWLVENGADVIIGSHPHVIQDAETIRFDEKEVQVAYSLGNAISNMSAQNTQAELMATLKIVRHINNTITILPLEFTYLWSSRPGGYSKSYTILPIKEFLERRQEWLGEWEYEKMKATYQRVAEITGIKEN